ncbi:hypothetical protein FYJ43_00480 [Cutibacterium sp. WCA-380-WT-3A]|uniref:Uncharacterized protein n=1 Tax=Cutibacterium porci TaxID=2605781 RepID=A0A7K0J3R4_9ACTN|nr:hypothetical protein [Cutibacterium porci]MSS44565.1 hypothetical protein [Cutibacterium porci]
MNRRSSEENILDVRARLGHVDQGGSHVLDATTESARVSRSAGAFIVAMAISGLVWGLTLAIWATGPGIDGTRTSMPTRGWLGSLLVGLLYAMGVTVILLIPVVLMAALLGGHLVRRSSQRIAGGAVCAVAVVLGAAGLYALIPDMSAVVEISWPALVAASALGCWWGPWVMVGRRSR